LTDYQKISRNPISVSETQPSEQPTEATVPAERQSKKESLWLKYFLHGISFSILLLILGTFWAAIFALLLTLGGTMIGGFIVAGLALLIVEFIGFIIGPLVLLFLVGGLNSFLTEIIWSIHVKTGWIIVFLHGLVLFIALVIAGIPWLIANLYVASNLPTQIALFIIYAFIDGFVAKKIGEQFEEQ